MRFEFSDRGRLCAAGYMKGAAVGANGLVPNAVSYAELGVPIIDAELPAPVVNWLAAERGVVATDW